MIQAQSADGVIHQFPDGTDPAVVDRAMKQYAGQPQQAQPKRSWMDDVSGAMANVNRGLGIGDELAAAAHTVGDVVTGKAGLDPSQGAGGELRALGRNFNSNMAHQRQVEDSYAAAHPNAAAFARGTGNALTMVAPVGAGAEAFAGGNVATNMLRGATTAGLTGAGYAAVDRGTPAERLRAASDASHDPLTLGLGAAAGAAASVRPRAVERPAAPSLDELTARKDAAYKAVDDSGVHYTPEAFQGLTQDMATALDSEGFNAGLHPKTAAMLERLGQSQRGASGMAPTLTQLDQLRQQIGRDVASSPDAGERRMGQIMRDRIDNFIDNASPAQIAGSADPAAAAQTIGEARDLNTRVAKLRSLDNLDEAAADRASVTGSGGNINNATRQNVLRFKTKTKNLTPDEEAAAQQVIDGTPTGNLLRQAGKLSPQGNGLMLGGQLAAAIPTHGVSGIAALGGAIAKKASDAITARNVQALRDLIASGGEAASEVSKQLADPQYADLRAQLANDLSAQAGVQGASHRAPIELEVNSSTNPDYLAWRAAHPRQ